MKLEEMAAILGKKALLFANYKLTSSVIKAWSDHYQGTSIEDFAPALTAAINEPGRSFFPSPGEVSKYLEATKPQLPEAALVWERLCGMAAGSANPWVYLSDNRAGQIALESIGWSTIKYGDTEKELPFRKREFIQIYNRIAESCETRGRVMQAIGHEEAKKLLNGLSPKLLEGAKQ